MTSHKGEEQGKHKGDSQENKGERDGRARTKEDEEEEENKRNEKTRRVEKKGHGEAQEQLAGGRKGRGYPGRPCLLQDLGATRSPFSAVDCESTPASVFSVLL
jgi:hypothetical protein